MNNSSKAKVSASNSNSYANDKYSYISCDSGANARVSAICREIKASGGKFWHDDGRLSGEEWRAQITDRINGSHAFILFVTKSLLERENRFVRNEFFFAGKSGVPMYAVMLDRILPDDIDSGLKRWYEEIQDKCAVITAPSDASPREIAALINESVHFAPDESAASPETSGNKKNKENKIAKSGKKDDKDEKKKEAGNGKKLSKKTKMIILAAAAAALLLIILGIFVIPEVTISADPQNFTYDIVGQTVTITSLNDDEMSSVKIPSKIDGKQVTKIGEAAFSGSANLEKVRMTDSVKEIQSFAFLFCEKLDDVQISDSVTKIGESAFSDCIALSSIKIPGAVIEIGPSAFQGCTSLRSVAISDSVKIIGESAFMNCTDLKKVNIPDSVTFLGGSIFEGCTSLNHVKLSGSIPEISFSSFEGCTELKEIVIPDSVKEIGDYAFAGCSSLKKAEIPASVENIVPSAFSDCPELTIYGVAGSAAEEYAQAYNVKFVNK